MSATRSELEAARRGYWRFHWGVPAERELQVPRRFLPARSPAVLYELGRLVDVQLESGEVLRPGCPALLCADPSGRRLYIAGRTRPVRGPTNPARMRAVSYRTDKGDGVATYEHEFRRPRPVLARDSHGAAVIRRAGSKYRVTWRGIEG